MGLDTLSQDDVLERRRVNIVSACLIAGVSRATIYRWMSSGKVDFVRTAGGQVRIFVDSLFLYEDQDA